VSFSTTDTIVAIATPRGRGGIGVVRISGPEARGIAAAVCRTSTFEPRRATLVRISTPSISDQAVVTSFPAPGSYTGEDVVEISAHGSPVLLDSIVEAAMHHGARLAEPGEFTLRAYLHGRMDLVQAEAVQDLVAAVTPLQARAAFDQLDGTLTSRIAGIDAALFDLIARLEASLDFPEEGYHFVEAGRVSGEVGTVMSQVDGLLREAGAGRLVREGAQVVILGRPNAGKSTLFNALAGAGRAIVTDVPGTTRDLLTEVVDIEGLPVTLIDTAGIRQTPENAIEAEGIARARSAGARAHLPIVVLDLSSPLTAEDRDLLASHGAGAVVVASKNDLEPAWRVEDEAPEAHPISCRTGSGIAALRRTIARGLGLMEFHRDAPAVTNIRHADLLRRTREALLRAREAAHAGLPEELVAADLADARGLLEEITGRRASDATLHAIFDRFCIGK
jgi:tRNA modification GTPase